MADEAFKDIGACVFDAYGTLLDVHSAVARGGEALGAQAQAVSALWRQKQVEYTWLRSLMGAHDDFRQVTQDSLDYALAAHGVDDAELRARLLSLYLTLDAYPDVKPCLESLRRAALTTAILSNGSPDMLSSAIATAGIETLLDAVLSVEEVGVFKPEPRVYQLAVERLQVPAARICFVSANAWDVAGAAFFGFPVVWLNRFSQIPERLPGAPSAVIASLDELPGLVGAASE